MKEINCPNCNQHIKILGTDYDLYLENLKKEEREIERLKEEYMILQNASDEVEEEKDKEIERQKEIIRQLDIKNLELTTIIKEVREYIKKNCILSDEWTDLDFCNFIPTGKITYKQLTSKKVKRLLEILDKVNNKTNEAMPVEELEKYEPKNMAELEYQEWFWEDNE